jgi:RHS repeat-associated protein
VLDYTSPLNNVIMEHDCGVGGLSYRNTYGLEKSNVVISGIPSGAGGISQKHTYPTGMADIVKLYYHHDRLGTTHYLTDNISGKVTSFVSYDDWGALTSKAIVRLGVRELDLVQEYTGHPVDMVLGLYYAKARMYDPIDFRWLSPDLLKGIITNPISLSRGPSININPNALPKQPGPPHKIESLPPGFEIVQIGNIGHYEIIPKIEMPFEVFYQLLQSIKLTPV